MHRVDQFAHRLSRTLAVCACVSVLAGCNGGGSPSITPTSLTVTGAQAIHSAPLAGGAFSGAYSGTYTLVCRVSLSQFSFSGTGHASFIHASSEKGKLRERNGGCQNQPWSGTATLASSFHPANTISVSLSVKRIDGNFPCSIFPCNFSVTSGTGKFKKATGNGTLTLTKLGSRSYSDTWSGTITY